MFASLLPKIADGMVIINALKTAIDNNDGSKLAREAVKKGKFNVQELMRKWGPQITIIASGDLAVLEASGFDNYKQPHPAPAVFTPPAVIVKDTANSGKVKVQVPAIPYADKYQYRYCTKANPTESDFITLDPGKRVVTVKDLIPVTLYYFSGRVMGVDSVSDWNELTPYNVR